MKPHIPPQYVIKMLDASKYYTRRARFTSLRERGYELRRIEISYGKLFGKTN